MMKKGFTLIEIVIATSILLLIASIVSGTYSKFNKSTLIKTEAAKIASLLYKAKSDTISSRGGMRYGIHFESSRVVLFQGESYSASSANNENFPLSGSITVSSINLAGGGADIVFQRLTGTTDTPGTIVLSTAGNSGATVSLSVSTNGIVTIQ